MKEVQIESRQKTPWWWVPTLYFAEGVPYFVGACIEKRY